MALSFLRGTHFIKDYFVKYLNYIFYANENNTLDFYDGTKKIEFSQTPLAIKQHAWDYRNLPVIEIGPGNGKFEMRSISEDFIGASQYGESENYKETGGDIILDMSFKVIATTMEERDNLVDIVGVYLSHPTAKTFFQQHMIAIEDVPTISEGGMEAPPDLDFKIFTSTLSMPIRGIWRDNTTQDDFLEGFNVYVSLMLEE